jgi:RNA polymerase sigma-70 factor (family 1)
LFFNYLTQNYIFEPKPDVLYTPPDDIKLIERLRKDDIEAFDSIYQKYAGKLYGFGLKYLRSSVDSQDLVQDTFVKIWDNRTNIKTDTSFKAYLFTIAYSYICKFFRSKKYHENFVHETIQQNPEGSYYIDQKLDSQSALDRVQVIIKNLPEKKRMIFMKSRFERKTTKEISEEVGLSPGTVDNYIAEISKLLRRILTKGDFAILLYFILFMS